MDDVKHTNFYRQDLKNFCNKFIQKLEPHVNEGLDQMFIANEDGIDAMKSLIGRISRLKAEDIITLELVLRGLEDGSVQFQEEKEPKEDK
jgi:hypothetical protein